MPETQLNDYYADLTKRLNKADERKMLAFLCGAPLIIMNMFNVELILANTLRMSLDNHLPIQDITYLLFLEKYVDKFYYID